MIPLAVIVLDVADRRSIDRSDTAQICLVHNLARSDPVGAIWGSRPDSDRFMRFWRFARSRQVTATVAEGEWRRSRHRCESQALRAARASVAYASSWGGKNWTGGGAVPGKLCTLIAQTRAGVLGLRGGRAKNPHKPLTRHVFVTDMAEHTPSANAGRTGPQRLVRHQNVAREIETSNSLIVLLLLVRKGGFEPPRSCERQPLKLVRLPVPPLPRGARLMRDCSVDLERTRELPSIWQRAPRVRGRRLFSASVSPPALSHSERARHRGRVRVSGSASSSA